MEIPELPFLKGFVRLCSDGFAQGWHERNAGNLTYRMTEEDVRACSSHFRSGAAWEEMGVADAALASSFFVTTAAGSYFRNIADDTERDAGIVEISGQGDAWRVVWGLAGGGRPTSEFPSHYLNHCVRAQATNGANRVIYHAHPPYTIAMTCVVPQTARDFTRALWKSESECPAVFPQGIGILPWMPQGGARIAAATCEVMKEFPALIWSHHGMFVSGSSFDEAFGLLHTVEQSAKVFMTAASSGLPILSVITDDQLRELAVHYSLTLREDFLD